MRIHLFPGMIFGLLGLNAAIVGVTIYLAHSDESFAVEPDYDQKALAWNSQAAQDRRSAELDWRVDVKVGPASNDPQAVLLRLTTPGGEPLPGAAIDLVAFHSARAGRRLTAGVTETGGGQYLAQLPIDRPGEWEFRVTIRCRDEIFTATRQVLIRGAP